MHHSNVTRASLLGLLTLALTALLPTANRAANAAPVPSDFVFPDAFEVRSLEVSEWETYEFVLSPVESAARELQIDDSRRLRARYHRVTWEIPRSATFAEVRNFLTERLAARGFSALFECEGRDCGRSNLWANNIWQLALLHGPNRSQFYLATQNADTRRLAALYLVQRGNRRIYANLDVIEPMNMPEFETAAGLARELRESGRIRLAGAIPSSSWLRGLTTGMSEAARQDLVPVATQLALFPDETIYLVCHLYGTGSTEELLDASRRWATLLAEALQAEGAAKLLPFGVGPLAPLPGEPAQSRIELVLP